MYLLQMQNKESSKYSVTKINNTDCNNFGNPHEYQNFKSRQAAVVCFMILCYWGIRSYFQAVLYFSGSLAASAKLVSEGTQCRKHIGQCRALFYFIFS